MSDGEFVSAWLNDERERSTKENNGKNRIRKLLGLLQELQSEADSHPGVGTWQIPGAQATEKNLQKLTHYYRSWPRYFIVGPRYTDDTSANGIGITHMWLRGGIEELQAHGAIEALVRARMLDRLALCQTCGKQWVFRRKSDRQYCSTKCRQARYEASAQRRAKKAERNREYYERKLKSLRSKNKKRRTR